MLPRLFALWLAIVIPAVMACSMIVFMLADSRATHIEAPKQPAELGRVNWQRDYAAGLAQAKRDGKPMLLLFDEVPG